MKTLIAQNAVALALLGLGIAALLAARSIREPGLHKQSWWIMGAVVLSYSAIYVVQVCFATAAYFLGPEAGLYKMYLVAAPIGNHARTVMLFVLYLALGAVALRKAPISRWTVFAAIGAGAGIGGAFGGYEGRLEVARHFSATAVLDTFGFLLLGCVLILAIHRDSMDRLLWFCMGLLGLRIIVGVLYHTGLAWYFVPQTWTPPPLHMHLIRLVVISMQIGVAVERIRRARLGIRVPGMLSLPERRTGITLA